jgi:hypothetical protein
LLPAAAGFAASVLPFAFGALYLLPVHAQQPITPLKFEVASAKLSNAKSKSGTAINLTDGGRFQAAIATLKGLMETADDVRS